MDVNYFELVRRWIKDAEQQLRFECGANPCYLHGRKACLMICSCGHNCASHVELHTEESYLSSKQPEASLCLVPGCECRKLKDAAMKRTLALEIDAGETTCITGGPCPHIRVIRFGSTHLCGIFNEELRDENGVASGPGSLQRLPQCLICEKTP